MLLFTDLRGDAVRLVVAALDLPAAVGLEEGAAHRLGHRVGVEDHPAVHVACGTADGLDQGHLGAQEALLVGVEDGHQRDLGDVEPLAEQVDPDEHVELAAPQVADEGAALQGLDVGVQVPAAHAHVGVVLGEVLGHALRERGDEHPLSGLGALAHLAEQVVHLRADRPDLHLGIDEPGGADDLLHHHPARLLELEGARGWPRRRWPVPRAPRTPRTGAAGCRGPTAGGTRARPASPCGCGRPGTSRRPAGASGATRRPRAGSPSGSSRGGREAAPRGAVPRASASSSRCRSRSPSARASRGRTWSAARAAGPPRACSRLAAPGAGRGAPRARPGWPGGAPRGADT